MEEKVSGCFFSEHSVVYYLTTIHVAFSCHFLNLVGQIIFLMVEYIHMYWHNKFLPKQKTV